MSWRPIDPDGVRHGDLVRFGSGPHRVRAIATYDVPGEPDEGWLELEVEPQLGGEALFLSWGQGSWSLSDELEDDLLDDDLAGIAWKGRKPPMSIELMGSVLTTDEDEHHYKVKVIERRLRDDGTIEVDRYKARVTDYVDDSGSSGASLEVFDGGRTVCLDRPLADRVEWLPGGAHGQG